MGQILHHPQLGRQCSNLKKNQHHVQVHLKYPMQLLEEESRTIMLTIFDPLIVPLFPKIRVLNILEGLVHQPHVTLGPICTTSCTSSSAKRPSWYPTPYTYHATLTPQPQALNPKPETLNSHAACLGLAHPLLGWSDTEETRQPLHPYWVRQWEEPTESGRIEPLRAPPVHRASSHPSRPKSLKCTLLMNP